MITIAIRLDPARMANPDADLRYLIPDRIQEATDNRVSDDGYDYLDDDTMIIFMNATSPDNLTAVLEILQKETFCENKILDTAVIGLDSGEGYVVVYPEGFSGDFCDG